MGLLNVHRLIQSMLAINKPEGKGRKKSGQNVTIRWLFDYSAHALQERTEAARAASVVMTYFPASKKLGLAAAAIDEVDYTSSNHHADCASPNLRRRNANYGGSS
jgi:hypothetical protein